MLKLEGCVIKNGSFALQGDLEIEPGAITAVIGPSGAGTSSLLEAIAGFLPLTKGRMLWNGQDMSGRPPGKRPVAMLFQDGNLFAHMTAAQNVGLGLRADLRLTDAQRREVERALVRVGLQGYGARKPAALSGGQQSRVALARVLVQRRDLLLLDEPFAALGPALKAEMLELVAELARETGATVLMVSHDPDDARKIADKVVLVAEGRVHPPEDTGGLLDNPPAVLRDYLG